MPYIRPEIRDRMESVIFRQAINELLRVSGTPGDLNYMLTQVCLAYLERKGVSYTFINDIIGALENAKLEFSRRVTATYEDEKIEENGDVYDLPPRPATGAADGRHIPGTGKR